jgi:hypothetical protein
MNRLIKLGFLLTLVTVFAISGCTASKKSCSCPSKKGMIGY